MKLALIVAMGRENEIGKNNDMPWGRGLKRDLAYFKRTTMGFPIIMGRKTFESLPKGALPGRRNIVLTTRESFSAENVEVYHEFDDALKACKDERKAFVIGGGQVFSMALPLADEVYITRVDMSFPESDTFFPQLSDEWRQVSSEYHAPDEKNLYGVFFEKYEKIEEN